ncbi:chemotaxis protein CheW [Clostridium sp. KNHs205]|jgi:purine-binding chemotaxis protein CheW|uniref:chemotaxis protein CheW n=1 Tax=Clostridium sp. KNHs205 TaxID=1449050 RepID=UPI00051B8A83|nr:chemotaxis protein CheW [Clostridium sp. KNHs205]
MILKQSIQTKQVIFTLDNEEFGLDIMVVNAIEKFTDLIPVPNAPSFIHGIMNLRGDVIPVFSLRRKFGLSDKPVSEDTRLIITKSNGILMAFEVDGVKEIIEIAPENISETPSIVRGINTTYIQNVANIGGRMIILLNHDGILSSKEQEKIESILEEQ